MTSDTALATDDELITAWVHPPMRRVLLGIAMIAIWCALWREVSVANVLTGVLVAGGANWAAVLAGGRGGVRLWPLTQLAGIVFVDLVKSTLGVTSEILRPGDGTEEGIVAVDLPIEARQHLLMLVVAITVTPGTAVVDVDPATGTLYIHLLHMNRLPATTRHIESLTDHAIRAFPNPRSAAPSVNAPASAAAVPDQARLPTSPDVPNGDPS